MPPYPPEHPHLDAPMSRSFSTDDQAIDAWIAYMEMVQNRSPRTLEAYRMALERLQEFVGQGRSILEVDGDELDVFAGLWLHKRGIVALSRKPYISAVRGFFGWATEKKVISENPATEMQHPKTGRTLPRAIGLANAERLMCAPDLGTFLGIRDSAMLHLLVGCGLRVSGLCSLNQGDLRYVQVDGRARMVLRVVEKGDKERMLPVPREAAAILQVYLGHEDLAGIDRAVTGRDGRPDQVLFVSTRNTTVTADRHRGEERRLTRYSVHDIIQKYGLQVGIPVDELHPHALRHLYGTELTEEDVPTLTVSGLMGHADAKSTAIYVELSMRKKVRTVDAHAPLAKIKTPVSELLKRLPK